MILHEIHNLSNLYIIKMLSENFSQITDPNIIENYHPDFNNYPGNLFKILKDGRYRLGNGKYFVIEEAGQYMCSAGWNQYELEYDVALLLTRMYVAPKYRTKYIIGDNVLPIMIAESNRFNKIWITCNEHNKAIYHWFDRSNNNKQPVMFNNWPSIYKKFKPIGKKSVYNTDQYIVELIKTSNA